MYINTKAKVKTLTQTNSKSQNFSSYFYHFKNGCCPLARDFEKIGGIFAFFNFFWLIPLFFNRPPVDKKKKLFEVLKHYFWHFYVRYFLVVYRRVKVLKCIYPFVNFRLGLSKKWWKRHEDIFMHVYVCICVHICLWCLKVCLWCVFIT